MTKIEPKIEPLCSSGCDSDGSGRASVGLTTGIGWKVSELGQIGIMFPCSPDYASSC